MTTTTTTTTSSYLRSMYSMIVILILSMSILTSDNSNAIIPTVDGFVVVDSMAINRNNNWKKSMIGRATHRHHPRRRLWGWNDNMDDNKDDKNYRDALTLNRARTDIRHFLTQRSIQSFQFLLISCRDDVTSQWIEVCYLCMYLFLPMLVGYHCYHFSFFTVVVIAFCFIPLISFPLISFPLISCLTLSICV